jgi:hypothetical protein
MIGRIVSLLMQMLLEDVYCSALLWLVAIFRHPQYMQSYYCYDCRYRTKWWLMHGGEY